MTDKLNDNDRQRIEQFIKEYDEKHCWPFTLSETEKERVRAGAEYATIYEREQQAKENERFKELLTYSEDRNTIYLSKIEQLEAERSEVRNKVIEECIAKVNDRYGERISKVTLIELLNSLKTK